MEERFKNFLDKIYGPCESTEVIETIIQPANLTNGHVHEESTRILTIEQQEQPPILHLVCDPGLDLSEGNESDGDEEQIIMIIPPKYYTDDDESDDDELSNLICRRNISEENENIVEEKISQAEVLQNVSKGDIIIVNTEIILAVDVDNDNYNENESITMNTDTNLNEESNTDLIINAEKLIIESIETLVSSSSNNETNGKVKLTVSTEIRKNKDLNNSLEKMLSDANELKLECGNFNKKLKSYNKAMDDLIDHLRIVFTNGELLNITRIKNLNESYIYLCNKLLSLNDEIEVMQEKFVPIVSYIEKQINDEIEDMQEEIRRSQHFKQFIKSAKHFIEQAEEMKKLGSKIQTVMKGSKSFYMQMIERLELNKKGIDLEFILAMKLAELQNQSTSHDIKSICDAKVPPPPPSRRSSVLILPVPEVKSSLSKRNVRFHSSTKINDGDEDDIECVDEAEIPELADDKIKKLNADKISELDEGLKNVRFYSSIKMYVGDEDEIEDIDEAKIAELDDDKIKEPNDEKIPELEEDDIKELDDDKKNNKEEFITKKTTGGAWKFLKRIGKFFCCSSQPSQQQ